MSLISFYNKASVILDVQLCSLNYFYITVPRTRKSTKFSTGTKLIDGKSDPAVEITTSNGFFSG